MKVVKKRTRNGTPKPSSPKPWRGRVARRRRRIALERRNERYPARRRRELQRARKRARRRQPWMKVSRLIEERIAREYRRRRRHAASLKRDAHGRFLPKAVEPRAGDSDAPIPVDPWSAESC